MFQWSILIFVNQIFKYIFLIFVYRFNMLLCDIVRSYYVLCIYYTLIAAKFYLGSSISFRSRVIIIEKKKKLN